MGERNVPTALLGVNDRFSSLAESRVGEGKVHVELLGNDSGIGESGIVGAQETDNVGSEGMGAGNGSSQIGRAGHKKAGSPNAAVDNIGREDISIGGPEKVEEAAGAGKICREGIGTNVVLRRQKNVTDGSVGGSSSIAVQVGDRTNWKRAVSRSTFLSTTSRNTAQIWSSNILSASGF